MLKKNINTIKKFIININKQIVRKDKFVLNIIKKEKNISVYKLLYNYILKKINKKVYNVVNLHLLPIYKFIKLFIIYLIEKYYYKLGEVYFVVKASRDMKILNFFLMYTKLKSKLKFKKNLETPLNRFLYYYMIMLTAYICLGPISWFLLRVVTDPQNWVLYCFSQINLSNLL